jgi:hypothetical protein
MSIALDFEPSATNQIIENDAAVVLSTVRATVGSWPGPSSIEGGTWLQQPKLQQCALWLAEYGSSPILPLGWSEWKLRQYTDEQIGTEIVPVSAIGRCDCNRFADTVSG